MKQYQQDEIEILISNATQPRANSNSSYPLNSLDDRIFEVLTYSIFKNRLLDEDKALKKRFDNVILMQGIGEKGMDCILMKNNKIASVIQCKKYKSNLSDKLLLSELVKFTLHIIKNPEIYSLGNKFTYYIATSTGFTGKSILLPNSLKSGNFVKEYDLQEITQNIIQKFKEFEDLSYQEIKSQLIKNIKSFTYEHIRPEDYDLWINDYPNLVETFFEVKKVTDNKLIEEKSKEIISTVTELFSSKEADQVKGFIENYRKIAIEKLNVINFIGFDIQKHRQRPDDITLTDLFIQPSFRQRTNDKNEKIFSVVDKGLKITNLFKSEKNIVILGDPGAGKSLLVKFLIVNILTNTADKIGIKQFTNHLPLRVELRKFNEVRENKSVVDYLADILNKEYQTKISNIQLEKVLEQNPSIIFFDGLDEIFNINHKSKIKETIELFSIRFKNAKCVVTSRFIGYHDIKFNSKKFDEFAILKFDKIQIRELITKFYQAQQSSIEKRKNAINNCLNQLDSDVDEELKSNPLILTLILILTSNNIIIPDSKLEIYESCTKTLVDSIDTKEKELKFEISVKNKNLTFSKLAYWQYESQSSNSEITYQKAVKTIADFLLQRKETIEFSDAESKAEKFLEYAERRSIYFENNFTHKTFLEYFTAEYLYSTCIAKASDEGRQNLITVVNKYLSNSFWYIVFELLFTRIDRVQPDNELLDEIFNKQLEKNSLDVHYFLIANLGRFNNVSTEIKSKIIEKTLMLCIKGEKMKVVIKEGYRFEDNSLLYKIHLLCTDKENRKLLQNVIYKFESDGLNEKQEIELYNLFYEINSYNYRTPIIELLEINNNQRVKELANQDILLFSNVYHSRRNIGGKIDIETLISQIQNFGHKSLFNYIPLRHIENARRIDSFDLYLLYILDSNDFDTFKSDLQKLFDNGLKYEMILNHVKNTRLLYFTRSEGLEKILKLYLKSDNKTIDEILEKIIRRDHEMKVAYFKLRQNYNNIKLKNIDKLFGPKNK